MEKVLKIAFSIILTGISAYLFGQSEPETDQHANFHVAGNSGYWTKHYEIANTLIKDGILGSVSLKNLQEGNSGKYYADLVDYAMKERGTMFSGKAIFTPDSLGYKVVLQGITYRLGASSVNMANAVVGPYQGDRLSKNVYSFENGFVKNGKLKSSGKRALEAMNDSFTKLFDFH